MVYVMLPGGSCIDWHDLDHTAWWELYNLHDLGHVAWWELCDLHDLDPC